VRILVTGGGGFIGRHLVRELSERGHEVASTTLSTLTPYGRVAVPDVVRSFSADLDDVARLTEIVAETRPECVVHLAGVALVTHPEKIEFYRTNVLGTENLLEAVVARAAPGSHVILASTAGVYGNQGGELLAETQEPTPANHYSMSKLVMEHVARQFQDRLRIRIVRPFNIIGYGQSEAFLVPKLVRHYVERTPRVALGNIEPLRDYVDIRDCVRIVSDLTALPPERFDVVNLCSGRGTSVKQVFEMLADITGHRPALDIDPQLVRANEVWRMVGSDAKLRSIVGRSAVATLRDTLTSMLSYYRTHDA
jgi:nucleoside-diphosphate-sugar epimerase